jgi:hypothetical protein
MNNRFRTQKTSDNQGYRNQLNLIRGLGATKIDWLNAVHIFTMEDLAQAAAKELTEQLKNLGCGVALGEVAGWIAQAQESQIEGWIAETQELVPPSPPLLESDAGEAAISGAETQNWQAIAAFSVASHNTFAVEFQTRQINGITEQRTIILHRETRQREVWASIDQERVERWILNQVKANLNREGTILETCVTDGPIAVEIAQVQFFQVDGTDLPMIATRSYPLCPDALLAEKPFDLKLLIQIPERAIADLANQLMVLHVSAEARHLATGEVIRLGETRLNAIGGSVSTFTVWLRDLILNRTGGYRLRLSATIENLPATPALFKIPVLEVASASLPACSIS